MPLSSFRRWFQSIVRIPIRRHRRRPLLPVERLEDRRLLSSGGILSWDDPGSGVDPNGDVLAAIKRALYDASGDGHRKLPSVSNDGLGNLAGGGGGGPHLGRLDNGASTGGMIGIQNAVSNQPPIYPGTSSASNATTPVAGNAKQSTTTTLSLTPVLGQAAYQLTAGVKAASGSGTPTGSVMFLSAGKSLGTVGLNSTDTASLTIPSANANLTGLMAVYLGDKRFSPSAGSLLGGAGDSAITFMGSGPTGIVNAAATGAATSLAFQAGTSAGSPAFSTQAPGFQLQLSAAGANFLVGGSGNSAATADVAMTFVGAGTPTLTGGRPLGSNTYAQVAVEGLYSGISLDYYSTGGQVEYDWTVAPGASASSIEMAFQGATSLSLDGKGDLVIGTPGGSLIQYAPQLYQLIDGVRVPVAGQFVINGNDVTFAVGTYSPTSPLIIDPITEYSTGPGSQPLSIIQGPDGNLYFVDPGTSAIGRITPEGVVTEVPTPTSGAYPASLTIGPDGRLWFTLFDANAIGSIALNTFTTSGITEYTIPGSDGETLDADGLITGPDGQIWVTEGLGDAVIPFNTTTNSFGTPIDLGAGTNPIGIASSGGLLYVGEFGSDAIAEIDPTSDTVVATVAVPDAGNQPFDVKAAPDGDVIVTMYGSNQIGVLNGTTLNVYDIGQGSTPWESTIGSDGQIYFASEGGDFIGRMSLSGTLLDVMPIPTAGAGPTGVVLANDGSIWFTESTGGAIGQLVMLSSQGSAVSATQGQAYSGAVATFSFADPSAPASQFSASIDWGDPGDPDNVTTGTVVADGDGSFTVDGAHSYVMASTPGNPYHVTVTIHEEYGLATTATTTATIAAAPLAAVIPPAFEPATTYATGLSGGVPDSVATLTLADGTPILLVANFSDDLVTVLEGNNAGGLSVIQSLATQDGPNGFAVGDFTGNGIMDFAVASYLSDSMTIYLGNADGTFSAGETLATGSGPANEMAIGDFTNDGKLDLVTANENDGTISVFLGNGDGTFQSQLVYAAGAGADAVVAGNFLGTGQMDLAVADYDTNQVTILANLGAGLFGSPTTVAVGANPFYLAAGDLDGSGRTSLVTANWGSSTVSILSNLGGGAFSRRDVAVGGGPDALAIGDLSGNGILDIVVSTYFGNGVTILWGNGAGGYTTSTVSTGANSGPNGVALADVDDDGSLDIITADQNTDAVSVLLNTAVVGTPGVPVANVPLAYFTDTGGAEPVANYTASIGWGTGTTSTGEIVYLGNDLFAVYGPPHTYAEAGGYTATVTITKAQVPNLVIDTHVAITDDWGLTGTSRSSDPEQAYSLPVGEANLDLSTGTVSVSQPLSLGASTASNSDLSFALVYNSGAVGGSVTVEATLNSPADSPVPTSIVGTLTLNGVVLAPVTFSTAGHAPGDAYFLGFEAPSPGTGVFAWSLTLQITLPGGALVTQESSGELTSVDETSSPYGAGWGLQGVDQLVPTTGGVLWVTGSGDARYFVGNGPGAYTSPATDFGKLVENSDGSFTYTAINGQVENFNGAGLETSLVDTDGREWTFAYDGDGRLTTVTAIDGSVSTFAYGDDGRLSSISEPAGTLYFTHDGADLTGLTDAAGFARTFTYSNHLLTSDVWAPYDTSFSYNSNGQVTGVSLGGIQNYTIVSAVSQGTSGVAGPGSLLGMAKVTDGDGNTTSYVLDTAGRLTEEMQPNGVVQKWAYDSHGDTTTYTNGDGDLTQYAYDAYGDVTEIFNPDGTVVENYYNGPFHLLSESIDEDGNITDDYYNVYGELIRQIVGANTSAPQTSSYTWLDGLMTSALDPDNNLTVNYYNGLMQETEQKVYDANGLLVGDTTWAYNAAGLATQTTTGAGGSDPETNYTGYDPDGNVTSQTDANGNVTRSTFDASGAVTSTTDPSGTLTTFTMNAANQLTSQVNDANTATPEAIRNFYDPAGNIIKTIDPDGNVTLNSYDGDGNLLTQQVFDPNGTMVSSITNTYDKDGNVLTSLDGNGNLTVNDYNVDGELIGTQIYAPGSSTPISSTSETYDGDGDVLTQTDGDGNVVKDTYNNQGAVLTQQTFASGATTPISTVTNTYDNDNNLLTSTDGDGNEIVYTYDANGNVLTQQVFEPGNANPISSITNAYDLNGNLTTSTDGDGNQTRYTYDGDGNVLTQQVFAPGASTPTSSITNTYDADGNLSTSTTGDGNVTRYTYDANGNVLTQQTFAPGDSTPISSVTNTYDLDNNLLTSTTGDGTQTVYTYDANGNVLTQKVYERGNPTPISSVTNTYDLDGNLLTSTDGNGNQTRYTYDAMGNVLTQQTFAPGASTPTSEEFNTYDADGNVLTSTDGDGNVTVNTYDANGNVLTQQLFAPGISTPITSITNTYDADNNLLTTTNGNGDVTKYTYDGNGNVLTMTVGYGTPAAATTSYTYDEDNNQTSVTDPDGNTTRYTYNANGQVLTTTNAFGAVATNAYDEDGNLTSSTDFAGRLTTYSYQGDELVGETAYNADGSVQDNQSFSYDEDGNMTTATNSAGTYTMTYDGDRLMTQTGPTGVMLSYGYDADGNVTSIQDSQGGTTTMAYNADGQVTSKSYQDANTQLLVNFTYDGAGNLLTETRYSDLAGTQLEGMTQYGYIGNQVTSIVSTDGSGNVLSNYSYVYDGASQVISETDNGVTTNYAYNAAGELTQAGDTSYSYDANGNPTGSGYVIGTNNQLLSDGTYDYTYDANGNMSTQTTIATGVTWTYGYNNENQMTSAVQSNSSGTVLQSVAYTYDAFGNRVSESVTVGGVTTTTQFVYAQDGNLYETLNGAGAVQTKYVSGVTGPDSWLAQVNGSGGGAWLLQDHVDSVRMVVNLTGGTVLDSVNYDALGNITTETNSSQGSILKFQGGIYDAVGNTEQYASHVEANGRWTTPDALFPTSGSNAYEFDGNDPVNQTDPTGLRSPWYNTGGKAANFPKCIGDPYGSNFKARLSFPQYQARWYSRRNYATFSLQDGYILSRLSLKACQEIEKAYEILSNSESWNEVLKNANYGTAKTNVIKFVEANKAFYLEGFKKVLTKTKSSGTTIIFQYVNEVTESGGTAFVLFDAWGNPGDTIHIRPAFFKSDAGSQLVDLMHEFGRYFAGIQGTPDDGDRDFATDNIYTWDKAIYGIVAKSQK